MLPYKIQEYTYTPGYFQNAILYTNPIVCRLSQAQTSHTSEIGAIKCHRTRLIPRRRGKTRHRRHAISRSARAYSRDGHKKKRQIERCRYSYAAVYLYSSLHVESGQDGCECIHTHIESVGIYTRVCENAQYVAS